LFLGLPPSYSSEFEVHQVKFERYLKMPRELTLKKEKLVKAAKNDPNKRQALIDEESINPWLITDLDYSFSDIGHANSD